MGELQFGKWEPIFRCGDAIELKLLIKRMQNNRRQKAEQQQQQCRQQSQHTAGDQ